MMLNKTEKLTQPIAPGNDPLRVQLAQPAGQNGALPEITSDDFFAEVLVSKRPVLVEFWTPWSRPCQILDSVLRKLAVACAGKVKVVKVNADDSLELSLVYDIQSVPTLLCFVKGNPRWSIVGTATSDAIRAKLNGFLQ